MKLVLPREHRFREALQARRVTCVSPGEVAETGLLVRRIGVINLMPKAQDYEELLLSALGAGFAPGVCVEPVWIRLQSHRYASSDREHLAQAYAGFEQASERGLSGLILTGAPVEELAFPEVRYWDELLELLSWAQRNIPSTLGLCWGAMALAKLLDIEKHTLPKKLFGVFPLEARVAEHSALRTGPVLWCAQSRHAQVRAEALEQAESAGVVRLLAHSNEASHSIFESSDQRFLMHQGHPEYRAERLVLEYERDRKLGRTDVEAPRHLDLTQPEASFRSHGPAFFAGWVEGLGESGAKSLTCP